MPQPQKFQYMMITRSQLAIMLICELKLRDRQELLRYTYSLKHFDYILHGDTDFFKINHESGSQRNTRLC